MTLTAHITQAVFSLKGLIEFERSQECLIQIWTFIGQVGAETMGCLCVSFVLSSNTASLEY